MKFKGTKTRYKALTHFLSYKCNCNAAENKTRTKKEEDTKLASKIAQMWQSVAKKCQVKISSLDSQNFLFLLSYYLFDN